MAPPLLTTMKERISPIWMAAVRQFERGKQWLMPRRQQAAFISAGAAGVLLLLIFSGVTAAVAAVAAWIALMRHFAQTDADRQRRITESYSKAVEQLAHEKIEVRLGGIYTLERISRESPDDHWTVMETLCAFVRERARWEASSEIVAKSEPTESRSSPRTDIAAVLAVIVRRDKKGVQRESNNGWRLDFREADLRWSNLSSANLSGANLSGADLRGANLSGANLRGVNLDVADLDGANLSGADLSEANLGQADLIETDLSGTSLSRANLGEADLSGADLSRANLGEADLRGADLSGADLSRAEQLLEQQLAEATGDASTQLPANLLRPAHWPAAGP